MKVLLLFIVLLVGAVQWREATSIGTLDDSTRPMAIFVRWDGVATVPNIAIPKDTWVTIDLANGPQWNITRADANGVPFLDTVTFQPNLPTDTTAVFLSGLLVITYPSADSVGICNVTATFRAPGSTRPSGNYQMQAIEASAAGGVRSNAAVWVTVINRKFEFFWSYAATPLCPSLINLSLQAYAR